jgi:hypothetical protein
VEFFLNRLGITFKGLRRILSAWLCLLRDIWAQWCLPTPVLLCYRRKPCETENFYSVPICPKARLSFSYQCLIFLSAPLAQLDRAAGYEPEQVVKLKL